jgi:hypothetical protein
MTADERVCWSAAHWAELMAAWMVWRMVELSAAMMAAPMDESRVATRAVL